MRLFLIIILALAFVAPLQAYGPERCTDAQTWTPAAAVDTTNRTISMITTDGRLPKMVKVYNDNGGGGADFWFRFDGGTCAAPTSTNGLTAASTQLLKAGESQEYQVSPSIMSFKSASGTSSFRIIALY